MKKRHHNAIFDIDTEKQIVEAYKSGLTLEQVGSKYKVNPASIRNILLHYGEKPRSCGPKLKVFSDQKIKEICDLYNNGLSQQKIAKREGISQSIISRILKKIGIHSGSPSKEKHHNWKGGVTFAGGYKMVLLNTESKFYKMTNTMGYVMEHRYVMAKHLNRCLSSNETVHHINGDRQDNRIENLQLRQGKHGKNQVFICCDCGSKNIKSSPL